MRCPSCARELKEGLKFCPHCGMRIIKTPPPEKPTRGGKSTARETAESIAGKWKIFVIIMVLAFGSYFGYIGYDAYSIHRSFKLCQFHRRTGSYYEAVNACEYLVERRPRKIEGWIELARSYKGLENYNKALDVAGKGLDWGKDAELYALKGEMLYRQDKFNAAADALDKALEMNPDHRLANKFRGYILAHNGKKEEAIPYLEKALADAAPNEIVEINYIIGDMYAEKEEYEKAIEAYRQVRNHDMNDIEVCMDLSDMYLATGRFDEALQESDRCVQIDPDVQAARDLNRKAKMRKERFDTIEYILSRKDLDDILLMLYSGLNNYIQRFNKDPEAFLKTDAVEISDMISDAEALYESYKELKPTEIYSHVHAIILSDVAMMIDTMKQLKRFITTGEQQYIQTLTRYLDDLENRMDRLFDTWKRENERMDIEKLREEAEALRSATSTTAIPSGATPTQAAPTTAVEQ